MQRIARVRQRQLSYLLRYSEVLVKNRLSTPTPPLFGAPVWEDHVWISSKSLAPETWSPWAIMWRCLR